jgi:hypothetical protein
MNSAAGLAVTVGATLGLAAANVGIWGYDAYAYADIASQEIEILNQEANTQAEIEKRQEQAAQQAHNPQTQASTGGSAGGGGSGGNVAAGAADCPDNNSYQVKRLSKGEIKRLKDNGIDPHSLKPEPNSRYDLFKDNKGNIEVRPKSGEGPGDPTSLNINNYK